MPPHIRICCTFFGVFKINIVTKQHNKSGSSKILVLNLIFRKRTSLQKNNPKGIGFYKGLIPLQVKKL
jgi:hypothetical protein